MKFVPCSRTVALLATLVVGACSSDETSAKGDLVDFNVSTDVAAADAGLPEYPGSKPYKDVDQSSSAANVGLSTPLFGVKVVAINLETPDGLEQVAKFYRQALSKYGSVLECASGEKKSSSSDLTCDTDETRTHSIVYKVGTKKNQRIVAIKSHGDGARFSLVHVNVRE